MADSTKIEWADSSWNPVVGCSIVSKGCQNCYAMKQAHSIEQRFGSPKYSGLTKVVNGNPVWTGTVRLIESTLDQPLRWKKPRRIFVNSMSDLFHESLPDDAIDKVFAAMALCPQHQFQVLTKRAKRMHDYFGGYGTSMGRVWFQAMQMAGQRDMNLGAASAAVNDWPLRNVWLGVSVEDQERANERVPLLLQTPAAVRFLSCEPLLGPLKLNWWLGEHDRNMLAAVDAGAMDWPGCGQAMSASQSGLRWVIVGGESGANARPCHLSWVENIVEQCRRNRVACFVKQLGKVVYDDTSYVGSTPQFHTSHSKGGDPSEWPESLRVRDFPVA